MREVVLESRACGACGAFVSVAREDGAVFIERRGRTFFRDSLSALFCGVPRERSGLAHAAGYAGLLSLFRYSFVSLTMSDWWPVSMLGWGVVVFCCRLAPRRRVVACPAPCSLERGHGKWRSLPVLVGFLLGGQGSRKPTST